MEKLSPRGGEGVGVVKVEELKLEEVEDSLTLCGGGKGRVQGEGCGQEAGSIVMCVLPALGFRVHIW